MYSSRCNITGRMYHLYNIGDDHMGRHMHGCHHMYSGRDHNLGRYPVSDGRYHHTGVRPMLGDTDGDNTYHTAHIMVHPLVFAWYALRDYIYNGTRVSIYGGAHSPTVP